MICPNCGRELSDHARVCPGCAAVQHVSRRRRRDIDLPEQEESLRVDRRIQPPEGQEKPVSESKGAQDQPADRPTPIKKNSASQHEPTIPQGLHKQMQRTKRLEENGRRVRSIPKRGKRKLDARPADAAAPLYEKSYKKVLYILFATVLLVLFVGTATGYMLFVSEAGQQMMAQWGWSFARTDSYISLGRSYYNEAYFTKALEKLEVAIEREPENVDALNIMAQCYTELGRTDEAEEIYERLIRDIAPEHPSAYRNLIRIYQQRGYNAEALTLMRTAAENTTGTKEFDVMLRESTPANPVLSYQEGRYNAEFDVTIDIPEGETVYYSVDGTDPSESGLVYTAGTKIHIPEGKMTVKAIGFTENGTPSEQVTANYTVIIPTPAAPKANIASGKLKKAVKVSLRPGSEDKKENDHIVAIYYTLDGRQATTESTLYNDAEPIQLPIGTSTLRAIAVADNGKISYEMKVTYEVEGNLKRMFNSQDTFKGLELYKTGYNSFTKSYGEPLSYELLPQGQWYGEDMASYEAKYDWGTARFVEKSSGSTAVLYYLDTASEKMSAPRSTKVGMSDDKIMEKFRDLGHPTLDEDGNRLLYNYNSAGTQFGTFRKEADGQYVIHYYYPIGDKAEIFVELSYYLDASGVVRRIVWQRYLSEV